MTDVNPQAVRSAQFKTARKGLDPEEVRQFLGRVADELERAQNQSTAMEARARAAVARVQELSEAAAKAEQAPATPEPPSDDSETISRTLLLAQRTADQTVAEANAESERIVREANEEAARAVDGANEESSRLLEQAKVDARSVGESERLALEAEVNALMARRDFLESDVEHLEQFLVAQRSRLRDAAASLVDLTERIPGGLGEVRRPLLSASDDGAESFGGGDPDEDTDPYGVVATEPAPPTPGTEPASTVPPGPSTAQAEDGGGGNENVTGELAHLVAETDAESPAPPPADAAPVGSPDDVEQAASSHASDDDG